MEKEVEKQLPRVQPQSEFDWDTSQLPIAMNIQALGINVLDVPTMFASTVALKGIRAWSGQHLFATENFYHTVIGHQRLNMDDYLRPVDAVVAFPDSGEILLLSDREADLALDAFWKAKFWSFQNNAKGRSKGRGKFKAKVCSSNFFTNFGLWRNSFPNPPGLLPAGCPELLRDASRLVSIQSFMGDTRFKEEAQKKALRDLVAFIERVCDARAIKEIEAW